MCQLPKMINRLIQGHNVEKHIGFGVLVDAVHSGDSSTQSVLWSGDEHRDLFSCPTDLLIGQKIGLKRHQHSCHRICTQNTEITILGLKRNVCKPQLHEQTCTWIFLFQKIVQIQQIAMHNNYKGDGQQHEDHHVHWSRGDKCYISFVFLICFILNKD